MRKFLANGHGFARWQAARSRSKTGGKLLRKLPPELLVDALGFSSHEA